MPNLNCILAPQSCLLGLAGPRPSLAYDDDDDVFIGGDVSDTWGVVCDNDQQAMVMRS